MKNEFENHKVNAFLFLSHRECLVSHFRGDGANNQLHNRANSDPIMEQPKFQLLKCSHFSLVIMVRVALWNIFWCQTLVSFKFVFSNSLIAAIDLFLRRNSNKPSTEHWACKPSTFHDILKRKRFVCWRYWNCGQTPKSMILGNCLLS